MALKTDFEDANFIASPFVDEIANPGDQLRAAPNEALRKRVRGDLPPGTSERTARVNNDQLSTALSEEQKVTIAATNKQVADEEKRTGVKHRERVRPAGAPSRGGE